MPKKTKEKVNSNNKKKIFFVCHAETYANVGKISDDGKPQHIRINEKGHDQAKSLVKKIKNPSKIIVSRFFRTLETAWYTMDKNSDIDVHVFPDIHEFTYISNEKFLKAIGPEKNNFQIVHDYWAKADPKYNDGDNAESFFDFAKRVHRTIEKLKKMKNGNIYVFTHGNFTRGFLILTKEFPKLLKSKKISPKDLKNMMLRFHETYQKKEYHVDNCQITDVTDLVRKY